MFTYIVFLLSFPYTSSKYNLCHTDSTFDPEEGMLEEVEFKWLGALQYINIKTGTPHYFRVPRVVLVTTRFVLSTAADAALVPEGYALGNIVFPDYERDEKECGITVEEAARGAACPPVVLYVPIEDVVLHPQYKYFSTRNSVALIKLLTAVVSHYMLPVCLPLADYVINPRRSAKSDSDLPKLYHVDFISTVPRDYFAEEKEVSIIQLMPEGQCDETNMIDVPYKEQQQLNDRQACSTESCFNSGAPTVVREGTGHWTLIALSQANSPCSDPLSQNKRRAGTESGHLLVYPYTSWISEVVYEKTSPEDDSPFGYVPHFRSRPVFEGLEQALIQKGWVGRWWMGGVACYDRGAAAASLFRFYHETFVINPQDTVNFTYFLEIHAAYMTIIECVKVGEPYPLGQPIVWGLNTGTVNVDIPLLHITRKFQFEVEAWARNTTKAIIIRADIDDEVL